MIPDTVQIPVPLVLATYLEEAAWAGIDKGTFLDWAQVRDLALRTAEVWVRWDIDDSTPEAQTLERCPRLTFDKAEYLYLLAQTKRSDVRPVTVDGKTKQLPVGLWFREWVYEQVFPTDPEDEGKEHTKEQLAKWKEKEGLGDHRSADPDPYQD